MSARKYLILILLVGAALRFYALGRASFWYDEFGSLEASTGRGLAHLRLPTNQWIEPVDLTSLQGAPPAWKIWTSLDLDNHPPLYFLVLRITRDALGDSEWAVRLPSAIFSLMAMLFFFLIVRMQIGERGALVAAGLMAVAGSQIALAREARPYAMCFALLLVCGWLVMRIQRAERGLWKWAILCALSYAALLTHYLAGPALVSLIFYSLVAKWPGRFSAISAIFCGLVLFVASWGWFFVRQLHTASANNAWQYDENPDHAARILWHLIQLPARWLSEPAAELSPLAILIFVACVYAVWRCRKTPGVIFWGLWCASVVLLVTTTDILRHAHSLYFMRYTFAAAPLVFFAAAGLTQRTRIGCIVPAMLGCVCVATLPAAYSKVMDWRNVAIDLRVHVRPGDTIIFTPGDNPVSWSQATVLGISHYAPHLPAAELILPGAHSPVLAQAFRKGSSTWVIDFDSGAAPNMLDPSAKILHTGIAPSLGRVSQLQP